MFDKILAAFAFATLVGFLGILLLWVPRLDLGLVIGATVLLAFIDLFLLRPQLKSADPRK
ncbi:hypothetical protein Sa4125_32650 [Aureimonas sp. SA4125]|uniref:hypothetical protein n=1 Tax=Aureimonas sp. SA4125 TaxID=2826993 RepID=UPI001CC54F36|nr:hypothetical protein [Aureimonas sp. SA4125]BDA85723.1 hypothetical protein Sa4125_32650 [Aureimonas sp. SA4125]